MNGSRYLHHFDSRDVLTQKYNFEDEPLCIQALFGDTRTMTDQPDPEDTRRALDALESHQERRAKFFLRRALGEETQYEEIGGHIFEVVEREEYEGDGTYESKECAALGCELMQTHDDWEVIKSIAESMDCPAPLEGIDTRLPNDGF